jgi:uncharacterized membrane protein
MNLRRQLKTNAKKALSGHWGRAVGITALTAAVWLVLFTVQGLVFFLLGIRVNIGLILGGGLLPREHLHLAAVCILFALLGAAAQLPLRLGVLGWFYRLGGGEPPEIFAVFDHFSPPLSFGRALWLYARIALGIWLRASAVFLLCGVLSAAIWTGLYAMALSPQSAVVMIASWLLGLCLFAVGIMWLLIACQRYFLAPYLLAARPGLRAGQAIRLSAQGAKGHKTALAVFALSFWGWRILAAIIPPLGLYTLPYRLAASGLYARYLIEAGNLRDQ